MASDVPLQTVLQSYFDELLLETETDTQIDAGVDINDTHSRDKLKPHPDPLSQNGPTKAESSVEPEVKTVAESKAKALSQLDNLKEAKRERLQKLLNSKTLTLPSETPAPTEVEAPVKPAIAESEVEVPASIAERPLIQKEIIAPNTYLEEELQSTPQQDSERVLSIEKYLAWNKNGRPEWAQDRFDALLFNVSGLTLAVPLIALGQIQALDNNLNQIFGQADWFMGVLQTPMGDIRTVNTALFVMPDRYDEKFLQTAKYVVSIDGLPWGLAVDDVNQPISLDPDDVKWRTERTSRPWLAGTVKSAMSALIDIPQMGRMLMESDKNTAKGK